MKLLCTSRYLQLQPVVPGPEQKSAMVFSAPVHLLLPIAWHPHPMAVVQKKNDASNQYTLKGGSRTKTSSSVWVYIPGREVYRDYQPGYRLKLSRG